MVLERAAKMAAESKEEVLDNSIQQEGMRLAAEYLKNPEGSLLSILQGQENSKQVQILEGMADTLLRNIILPRDEHLLESGLLALSAVVELSSGEVGAICQELQQILQQYTQHKEQMKQQLDDAIIDQLKQKLAQQGAQISEDVTITPSMHPQYAEELDKMLTGLNGQYTEALDQRKDMLRQRLLPSR